MITVRGRRQENNYSNYLTFIIIIATSRKVQCSPSSPDYARNVRNVPIMLESVPIMLPLCLIFQGPIMPHIMPA